MLRPGIVGLRGPMVIRLRPCTNSVHPPPPALRISEIEVTVTAVASTSLFYPHTYDTRYLQLTFVSLVLCVLFTPSGKKHTHTRLPELLQALTRRATGTWGAFIRTAIHRRKLLSTRPQRIPPAAECTQAQAFRNQASASTSYRWA